ncbi:hypothetical protein AVEN_180804-1 [Araneus ventricosus]|uniref:Uncharacterized protein n=1 Tax=Araneus ventricosus TaxID=182803 RepID=A0A4Y2RJ25_ARAVE|nr:hypothetical protein AVEN_180804-1 [Araneus ventricosus]
MTRLGYINVPFSKQHEGYLGTDFVILNSGQMARRTPELALPSPNFCATPTGGRLATTYDLACNRPHTRRIFSGIGVLNLGPSGPEVETLSLDHHGHSRNMKKIPKNNVLKFNMLATTTHV